MEPGERPKRRGRKPTDSTAALRELLERDFDAGGLQDAEVYARWLVEQDAELGLIAARRIVHRELRRWAEDDGSS